MIAGGEPMRGEDVVERNHVGGRDMRQHQVLRVVDARFALAEALGEIGDELHGVGARVARRPARLLQRDDHGGVAAHAMRPHILLEPIGEDRIGGAAIVQRLVANRRAQAKQAARNRT